MMRCANFGNGKRSHSSVKRGVENVAMTTNDKINKKNDKKTDSPRSCQEQSISGHSTPITKKRNTNADKEGSPDFDYSPSPILPTFTQEGGNEVAWDWQSSLSRTPENRNKKQNVHCETPKGTKLLQRKRNSNSPLLYKPLKRKTIKMENIENIGQFAAELQALNERMRVIKQNNNNHSNDCVEEKEVPTLTNISNNEETPKVQDDKQNSVERRSNDNEQRNDSIGETNDHSDTSKKETSGNYDDLFDDSVDDDIIRCTQEIEEKFNLLERGNSTHLQIKREDSCKNDISNKTSVQSSSSENCKNPLRSISGSCNNSTLKTYSKLSLRRDANSSIHSAVQKSNDTYKPCSNNNNTIRSYARKPCDNKKLSKSNTIDLFDFQNDSFDDWFASCVEEEKLFPKSDVSSTHKNNSTKVQANYKHLTNAPLKSEAKSADSLKPTAKPETSNANYLQNRKFFKTKSLSEQHVNRDASINAKGSRASVSTKLIVTNDCKAENNAISLMHGVDRMRGSNVNRCAVKSDGNHFIKHHSTGNMKNDTQEMAKKSGSQPATRCTAEEIERKRLQAVARLEARRKLHFTKITNNINR
ncbi:hypothetical protein ALC60_10656 [Trachymyrmex zeteki]|uniref:Uncharacterized protein n=1 Tax=Mycetomoellerius zeteki TaxID=64791 RepID=A0A151WR09_9HYME|nr:PREDICTED: putative uncharacterized protein DDB_G0267716 isoform X1 [Trachymyrmex zeteki]KYQ50342.1 hypothetical protein ALC60_10656 [Trachymyrmex zeteki]